MIPALVVALLLAAGVALNWRLKLDVDPGGYRDGWRTTARFPDKAVHGVVAFGLTLAACVCGVPPVVAAVLVLGAGAGFEVTQGSLSWRDLVADAVGAGAATALWLLARCSA